LGDGISLAGFIKVYLRKSCSSLPLETGKVSSIFAKRSAFFHSEELGELNNVYQADL